MTASHYCRTFGYLCLLPFLVFTYQTWCGPIEDVKQSARGFAVFSSSALIFFSGCWWGNAQFQPPKIQSQMMIVGLLFALGSAATLAFTGWRFIVIALGLAHIAIWLLEFFVPKMAFSYDYKIQRTILTMVIVVCHMLVGVQFWLN